VYNKIRNYVKSGSRIGSQCSNEDNENSVKNEYLKVSHFKKKSDFNAPRRSLMSSSNLAVD
jgi:hypothetical protein